MSSTRDAERELISAILRYDMEVPGLGERFYAELRAACAVLLDYRDIGARVDADLRRMVLERFPYSLIYGRIAAIIYILAIAHERLPPGYWSERSVS